MPVELAAESKAGMVVLMMPELASSTTISGPLERRQCVELHAVVNNVDFVIEAMGDDPAVVLKEKERGTDLPLQQLHGGLAVWIRGTGLIRLGGATH